MNASEALNVVNLLVAAFPSKSRTRETVDVFAGFVAELDDYELAGKAARTLINENQFFPKFSEFRTAYYFHAAAARRERERSELTDLLAEASVEERVAQLERMRAWFVGKWPTP